jgi:hypothetical protein
LFWPFADSIETELGHHVTGYQFDPPYDYGCPPEDPKRRCFREFVEIVLIAIASLVRAVYREVGVEAMRENAEWVAVYRQRPIQPLP